MLSVEQVRDDIPLSKELIYLDSASTSLTPKIVVDSMVEYYAQYNSNMGRGAYSIAVHATQEVEKARRKISKFIHTQENNEIIFTKNTTEAVNIISHGLPFNKTDNILVSGLEHHSNMLPWLKLQDQGISVKIIEPDNNGFITPEMIEEEINNNTHLVASTHIANATGSYLDVKEISKIAHEHNSLYIMDGAQSIGHTNIDIQDINPDFAAFPGHKGTMGPAGTGFLYLKKEHQDLIEPYCLGGGTVTDVNVPEYTLEDVPGRFEGGTQNIPGFIGLGHSIDYINKIGISNIEKHTGKLTQILYQGLKSIENVTVYGDENNIYSIVSFNIHNMNPHDVAKILDESCNICVRSGHHCAIPLIKYIGAEQGSIRASIHYYNTEDEIIQLINNIREITQLI